SRQAVRQRTVSARPRRTTSLGRWRVSARLKSGASAAGEPEGDEDGAVEVGAVVVVAPPVPVPPVPVPPPPPVDLAAGVVKVTKSPFVVPWPLPATTRYRYWTPGERFATDTDTAVEPAPAARSCDAVLLVVCPTGPYSKCQALSAPLGSTWPCSVAPPS